MAKNSCAGAMPAIFLILAIFSAAVIYLFFKKSKEGFENEGVYKFIMYHSPSCGHCVRAKPEFLKLGGSQNVKGKTVLCSMVNPQTEPDKVLNNNKIRGYPTFHLYGPDSKLLGEFAGQRTLDNFTNYLNKMVN
jgi:thiol-disulfide isomerase/thioredoxin